MADVAVDQVLEVRCNANLYGQRCMTILHYACTAGIAADWADFVTAFHTKFTDPVLGFATVFQGAVSDDMTGSHIDYQIIRPTRFYYIRKAWSFTGAIVDSALPPGNSVAITKKGSIAGIGRAGHVLYAGLPVGEVANGMLQLLYQTGPADLLADTLPIIHTAESMTFTPIISIEKIGGEWNKVIDAQVEATVRTMSRRVVGRGI